MSWQVVLVEPAKALLGQIGSFFSSLLGVILILVIGWLVAKLIRSLVIKLLEVIKIDTISEKAGIDDFLSKGGVKYSLSELIGILCYWLCLLVVLVVAINALGLTVAADLLNKIVLYIPNVIAAVFILVLGMFGATFLGSIVQASAVNAGIHQSKLLAKVVEFIIAVFAIAIALEQLHIGTTIIALAVNIILASVGLAVALAFGLGCKDIAARYISELLEKIRHK